MWKDVFKVISNIVNLGLLGFAFYHGIFNEDYAQASFLLLLVLINRED